MSYNDHKSERPMTVKPSKKCIVKLEDAGIFPYTLPTYNNVVKFFSTAKKKITKLDNDGLACVKRQVTLMKKNAGNRNNPARIVINQEKNSFNNMIDKRIKQLENGKTGRLKMAAPRELKFSQ